MSKEIRPDYYKSEDGQLEAFDVIYAFGLNFNRGNAFKYIIRAGKKEDEEKDIKKAITYLERELKDCSKKKIIKKEYLDGVEKILRGRVERFNKDE